MKAAVSKTKSQFDARVDNKQEHPLIGVKNTLNFFAFLFIVLNKTSILLHIHSIS